MHNLFQIEKRSTKMYLGNNTNNRYRRKTFKLSYFFLKMNNFFIHINIHIYVCIIHVNFLFDTT